MYQVFNTQTNEPVPVLSETPYELSGPLAERKVEQKRDEQGNLLYLTTTEVVDTAQYYDADGNYIPATDPDEVLQTKTIEIETTEATWSETIAETWDEQGNVLTTRVEVHQNPPVMVDAGPVYEWREVIHTLDELKLAKRQEINQAKDSAEAASPFWYMEKPFDFDPLSRERLNVAIQLAQSLKIAGVPGTQKVTDWKLYDNTLLELTVDALCDMPQAFAAKSAELHQKAWLLKGQVDAATTKEGIEIIKWGVE